MLVLVTPDILEMETTAKILDVFLLKPFPSEKKSTVIFTRLVLPAYLVLTLSLLTKKIFSGLQNLIDESANSRLNWNEIISKFNRPCGFILTTHL